MFRSLAGYIFGGTKDDPSDEPVECDAKEENDWLVVNVTDRPMNAGDLDESVIDYDMEVEVGNVPAPKCSWVGSKYLLHEESRLLMEQQKAIDNHKKVEDGDGLSPVCNWSGPDSLLFEETRFSIEKQALASNNVKGKDVLSPACSWEGQHDRMPNESKFDELSTFPDTQIACPNVFEKGPSQKPLTLPNAKTTCTKSLDETPIKSTQQILGWSKQKPSNKKSSKRSTFLNAQVNNTFMKKPCNKTNFVVSSNRYEIFRSVPFVETVTDENFPALPVAPAICSSIGNKLAKKVEKLPVQMAQSPKKKCCTGLSYAQVLKGMTQNEIFCRDIELKDNLEDSLEVSIEKMNEIYQKRKEKKMASCPKSAKRKMTCQSVYSEANMNNHSSALFNKADILQRIKELEPEQRAVQHVLKKNITRGQLTRLNKAYLYDTSTKRNRRKDLQRNPSGANNNRKC